MLNFSVNYFQERVNLRESGFDTKSAQKLALPVKLQLKSTAENVSENILIFH